MSASRKVVEATVEVVDIAGLVAGAEHGEGLGNRFLGGIREVDALCFVLRSFADDAVPGESDPLAALGVLELELVLADLASLEGQLAKQQKAARTKPVVGDALHAMEAAQAVLSSGVPLYRSALSAEEKAELVPLFLLTNKPFFCVVNLGEDEVAGAGGSARAGRRRARRARDGARRERRAGGGGPRPRARGADRAPRRPGAGRGRAAAGLRGRSSTPSGAGPSSRRGTRSRGPGRSARAPGPPSAPA